MRVTRRGIYRLCAQRRAKNIPVAAHKAVTSSRSRLASGASGHCHHECVTHRLRVVGRHCVSARPRDQTNADSQSRPTTAVVPWWQCRDAPLGIPLPRLGRDVIKNFKHLFLRCLLAVGEQFGHGRLQRPTKLLAAGLEVVLRDDVGRSMSGHFPHEFQRHASGQGERHPSHPETVKIADGRPAETAFPFGVDFTTNDLGIVSMAGLAVFVCVLEASGGEDFAGCRLSSRRTSLPVRRTHTPQTVAGGQARHRASGR